MGIEAIGLSGQPSDFPGKRDFAGKAESPGFASKVPVASEVGRLPLKSVSGAA